MAYKPSSVVALVFMAAVVGLSPETIVGLAIAALMIDQIFCLSFNSERCSRLTVRISFLTSFFLCHCNVVLVINY